MCSLAWEATESVLKVKLSKVLSTGTSPLSDSVGGSPSALGSGGFCGFWGGGGGGGGVMMGGK